MLRRHFKAALRRITASGYQPLNHVELNTGMNRLGLSADETQDRIIGSNAGAKSSIS